LWEVSGERPAALISVIISADQACAASGASSGRLRIGERCERYRNYAKNNCRLDRDQFGKNWPRPSKPVKLRAIQPRIDRKIMTQTHSKMLTTRRRKNKALKTAARLEKLAAKQAKKSVKAGGADAPKKASA